MATSQIDGARQIKIGSISLDRLVEAVLQADGGQALTGNLPFGGFKGTGAADPSNPQDLATKAYVDSAAQGISWKASVRMATTGNITLSGTQTIDGIAGSVADRVLVKNQTTASENGLYAMAAGAWSRTTDADTSAEVPNNMAVFVREGTQADTGWTLTNDGAIVLGTTALVFTQFTGLGTITAGAGLTKTGSTIDVVANATGGLTVNADDITIKLNGTTLALAAAGLSVNAGGITATELAASVAGNGLGGGAGTALSVNIAAAGSGTGGLQITSDAVEIKVDPNGGLALGAAGIKNSSGRQITREVPTGTINGSNATFTLANTPIAGSEEVFLNGLLQNVGGSNDYTISTTTITYNTAPATGDVLLVSYRY